MADRPRRLAPPGAGTTPPPARAGSTPRRRRPLRARSGNRAVRAGILGALVVLCVLSVLGPLGTYVREQSNTAALQRKVAAAGEEKERLTGAVQRWDDPAFVGAQARDRLHYVLPGETGYVVLDLPDEPGDASLTAQVDTRDTLAEAGDGPTSTPEDPWYGRLWTSVEAAGQR